MSEINIHRTTRWGAYGVLLGNRTILLVRKKSGPYLGLWDLPGGKIEFGETAEKALKRELLEEVAIMPVEWALSHVATALGESESDEGPYLFHQIGTIYKVTGWVEAFDRAAEEEMRWAPIDSFSLEELTPFAREVVMQLSVKKGWRPKQAIRAKAIGLIQHKGKLLVCEVLDDEGTLKGWSPLGGAIEFGETAEAALRREIQEELGCEIEITGPPKVFENFFEHHGVKGHEIVFAFSVSLNNRAIYQRERFQICEDEGSIHWVEWVPIERFDSEKCPLYPNQSILL